MSGASVDTSNDIQFGTTTPPTYVPEGDNATYMVTSDGTATGVPSEMWKYDEETDTWVQAPTGGTTCPAPMTRAALLALRNASGLSKDCHYVVTDYNRGSVGPATILLHAVEPNVLGMGAQVKTGFDNIAWDGSYDIDSNRIVRLEDNLGNTVKGGGSVDSFPWGVTAVTGNTVDVSTLNWTGGIARNNTLSNLSVLTVSAGLVEQSTIADESNLTVNGASVANFTVLSDSVVTLNSGSHIEVTVSSSYTLNQVGTGYFRYSSFTGNDSWTNGNTNVVGTHVHSSTVNTTGSTGTISDFRVNSAGGMGLTNVPQLDINNSSVSDQGSITCTGAARLRLRYSTIDGGGRLLLSAGATVLADYIGIHEYGYIQSTAGTTTFVYCTANALGYIRNQSAGASRFERCHASSQGSIRIEANVVGGRIQFCDASSGGAIYIDGASVGAYIYYCSAVSNGSVRVNASVNTRMYYCGSVRGSVLVQNDGAQTLMYYCTALSAGVVQSLNNDNAGTRMYSCHADSQSIIRLQNCPGAGRLYYSSVTAYYYLLLTLTGSLTRSALHGYGRRSYTVTDPANGAFVQNF